MNAARNLMKKNEMMRIVDTAKRKYKESGEEALNKYLEQLHIMNKLNKKQVTMITDLITNEKGLVI